MKCPEYHIEDWCVLLDKSCFVDAPAGRTRPTGVAERQDVQSITSCGLATPVARVRATGATLREPPLALTGLLGLDCGSLTTPMPNHFQFAG